MGPGGGGRGGELRGGSGRGEDVTTIRNCVHRGLNVHVWCLVGGNPPRPPSLPPWQRREPSDDRARRPHLEPAGSCPPQRPRRAGCSARAGGEARAGARAAWAGRAAGSPADDRKRARRQTPRPSPRRAAGQAGRPTTPDRVAVGRVASHPPRRRSGPFPPSNVARRRSHTRVTPAWQPRPVAAGTPASGSTRRGAVRGGGSGGSNGAKPPPPSPPAPSPPPPAIFPLQHPRWTSHAPNLYRRL